MINAKLDVRIEAMNEIRTRFAPSPTGFLHIGGLRTALYAYALAKHGNGDFLLRIEDTDQKRQVKGASEALQGTLKKFGLIWDEFYVQSERQKTGIYEKAAKKLVEEGHAFYCQCKPKNVKEEGFSPDLRDICRDKDYTTGAVKLKVPEGETLSYYDFVHRKEISWNSDTVYDATLLKSDGFPTYHLAMPVDDLDMKISHVLRGHDWLPSTPIHLLVFKYLGGKRPEIGHLTDILSAVTGKKLSKRRDSVFVEQYLDQGYLPEALLNFVMLLGWAPKDNRELFTLSEFVEHFDVNGFQDANPRFLEDKLNWFNGEYIRQLSDEELFKVLKPFVPQGAKAEEVKDIIPLIKDRMKKLSDFSSLASYIFKKSDEIEPLKLTDKYNAHISAATTALKGIEPSKWGLPTINETLSGTISDNGFKTGDFYMDLRGTISGSKYTPPLNETLGPIGKDETIKRLEKGLEKYRN
jgi:glutamyl-tRNA synthetase